MDPKAQQALALGLVAALMIVARRWKNDDSTAGLGIAGWTIVILLFLLA